MPKKKSKKKKKTRKKTPSKSKKSQAKEKYFEAIGRRKTAVAQVRIWPQKKKKEFIVNHQPYDEYFSRLELREIVADSLEAVDCLDKFKISVMVKGGGYHAQAEAVRHGLARALVKFNSDFKKPLRARGYLTRDPRMKERKKPGLKRARRAPQWRKR